MQHVNMTTWKFEMVVRKLHLRLEDIVEQTLSRVSKNGTFCGSRYVLGTFSI